MTAEERYELVRPHLPLYDIGATGSGPPRRQAVAELRLEAGDVILDLPCGTGLNFPFVEPGIGYRFRTEEPILTCRVRRALFADVGGAGLKCYARLPNGERCLSARRRREWARSAHQAAENLESAYPVFTAVPEAETIIMLLPTVS